MMSSSTQYIYKISFFVLVLSLMSAAFAFCSIDNNFQTTLTKTIQTLEEIKSLEMKSVGSGRVKLIRLQGSIPSEFYISTSQTNPSKADIRWLKQELLDISSKINKSTPQKIDLTIERIRVFQFVSASAKSYSKENIRIAREQLNKVLSDQRYKPSFWDVWREQIIQSIGKLLSNLPVNSRVMTVIGWIILIAAITVLVGTAAFLIYRLLVDRPGARRNRSAVGGGSAFKKTAGVTVEQLLESAKTDAENGLYREAFRKIYLASIMKLDKAQIVKYIDGTTNWEYLRLVSKKDNNDLTNLFREMTQQFDIMIYGTRQVSSEDYSFISGKYKILEGMI